MTRASVIVRRNKKASTSGVDIKVALMFVQALEEALQPTEPLGVSGETLQDVWKHQVSFVHHTGAFLHTHIRLVAKS